MAATWLLLAAVLAMPAAALEVGDPAPDFELQGSDGATHRLSEHRGQRAVVVAWFPKAFTGGCTVECKSLAANGERIRAFNVAYYMASVDPIDDNVAFARDTGADFPLLSDPDRSTAQAWGVLGSSGYAARHTVYVGVDGRVLAIDRAVRPDTSAEDLVATLERLGVARREAH